MKTRTIFRQIATNDIPKLPVLFPYRVRVLTSSKGDPKVIVRPQCGRARGQMQECAAGGRILPLPVLLSILQTQEAISKGALPPDRILLCDTRHRLVPAD